MPSSVRASQASYVVLPESVADKPTVLSFLVERFNQIGSDVWRERIIDGKVHWRDGSLIAVDTPFIPRARVYYYREVKAETKVPFEEKVLYQDEQIILAFKPHFLALHPSGNFVNECLINRLRMKTGIETLVPAHRLDRATAGIVLIIVQPEARTQYHDLFKNQQITKEYQALAKLTPELLAKNQQGELQLPLHWTVKNRMVKGEPSFTMQVVDGESNTHSEISLIDIKGDIGLFKLSPITGRTHQLRVHMQSLGMSILNDRCYPQLQPKSDDDYTRPLKLVAKRLKFQDPVTGIALDIECEGFECEGFKSLLG
ncbi:pseudouridine synthase [Shewanella eurypsychrophilus]|uniref:Pseudouridine synthase n=1 Tax=Shewanella eurypsychrophilus TaxID=2593656 RepID=A0ABX6V272_9GAMM|nr:MULTISPECIES: pseudouridine synthase [Shewanella]QFU21187.1 pseudouridine synthase [Shewanella sp. YLB-09]QPG56478.1 pseudouridine synthase [Shewanella eurypsychrophilus]